jgi:uncharacterized iron-regulated membrane protein
VYAAFFLVHEVIGLVSGLVVAVVCLTGAILVLEDPVTAALHPARAASVPVSGAPLSLDTLVAAVTRAGEGEVATVTRYDPPARPVALTLEGGERLFVNPYTAAVVARQRGDEPFFVTMKALPRRLHGGEVGRRIVGVSTLAFLVVVLSGVWVWWPKGRRQIRARLTFARHVGWKRRIFDLHVVLGIYSVVLLVVFAATGLVWSFRSVGRFVDGLTPRAERTPAPPRSAPALGGVPRISLDSAFAIARATMHPSRIYVVDIPRGARSAISIMALANDAPWRQAWDMAYLDQHTGRVLRIDWFANRPLGEYARRITHPLHVGDLYGPTSQVLAFLACLVATIAPFTGFVMWVNRKWPRTFRRSPASRLPAR